MSDGSREFLFTSESVTEGHPDKPDALRAAAGLAERVPA